MAKRKKARKSSRRRRSLGSLGGTTTEHTTSMKSAFERAERELTKMRDAHGDCDRIFDHYDRARAALVSAEEHRMSANLTGQWISRSDTLKDRIERGFFGPCKVIARAKR